MGTPFPYELAVKYGKDEVVPHCENQRIGLPPTRRPRASGDPEPAPGMNRGRAFLHQLVVKITPLRIVALNQLKFPGAAPFLDPLFAENCIRHSLMKLDKYQSM